MSGDKNQGGPVIQVFGRRRCPETRKAVRFFKERGVRIQEIDVADKGPSPGELRAMAARLGWLTLIDREGARFRDRGLSHSMLTDPDIERLLLADGELLRTPIVRRGKEIYAGSQPEAWKSLL
jgi:arsenate reductase-like glutaredoxin family protein